MRKSKPKKKKFEFEYPVIAVAIDPGVTTGCCVMCFTETTVHILDTDQWGDPDTVWTEIADTARYYRDKWHCQVVLVVEQFDKRPGVVNPDFTPKYVCRDIENNIKDFEIIYQLPAQAMTLVKPARRATGEDQLKRFGWYQQKSVHSNDATRHAIVFGVETLKHRPLILKGWPKPEED